MLLVLVLSACSNTSLHTFASGGERHSTQTPAEFGTGSGTDTADTADTAGGDTSAGGGPAPTLGVLACSLALDTSSAQSSITCSCLAEDAQDDLAGGTAFLTGVGEDGTVAEFSGQSIGTTEGSGNSADAWLVDGLLTVVALGTGSAPLDVTKGVNATLLVQDQSGNNSDEVSAYASPVGS